MSDQCPCSPTKGPLWPAGLRQLVAPSSRKTTPRHSDLFTARMFQKACREDQQGARGLLRYTVTAWRFRSVLISCAGDVPNKRFYVGLSATRVLRLKLD